ncbi:MAG: hypothetical protein ABSE64_11885 [Vulcanimicrobiaceae bacterium]|jgi:hypothetical protein
MMGDGSELSNFITDVLGYQGPPTFAHEVLSDAEQRFFTSLVADDDIIVVLRGHLYIEADINDLLEACFPGSAALIEDLTYEQKVRRLRKSTTIPSDIATLLKAVGELRNSFAHSRDRTLTQVDDDRFFGAMSEYYKPGVIDLIRKGAFPDRPGARVRAAILVLHTCLCALRLQRSAKR